ncbi:MAG: glutathionylspermidine synthase family protein [Ignavibacteriales bacterium]
MANIYKEQRQFTDKLLFDYYLVSTSLETQSISPYVFNIDKKLYNNMVYSSTILDRITTKIIKKTIDIYPDKIFEYGDFLLKDNVLRAKNAILPFFWTRFDVFERSEGGIFFTEFNYDKPCAQREILISENMVGFDNPNKGFKEKFVDSFKKHCESFYSEKERPSIAILVDCNHYEELHLSYLYIDLLKPLGYDFIIAGPRNFRVENDAVYAFDRKVNIILRQYPTEFLQEVNDAEKILDLYEKGKILVLNDPRVIIGQAKSIFACMWDLAKKKDTMLTEEEIKVIKDTIPYTIMFEKKHRQELIANKDKYVVKSIYGRYSEEVYIGKMHSQSQWEEVLDYVENASFPHLIQEFCETKREQLLKYNGYTFGPVTAMCNYGVYLIDGKYAGICARWNQDYLTPDETVWSTPVSVRENSLKIEKYSREDRKDLWKKINDQAAFEHNYTWGYTGNQEAFTLDALVLDNKLYNEIEQAVEAVIKIIKKATDFAKNNIELISPVLDISEKISELINSESSNILSFVGRLDWVVDSKGKLKLLEFNSETPAGIIESICLNDLIHKNLYSSYKNPNENFKRMIESCLQDIIGERKIRNIGITASSYDEDWFNTETIYQAVKELPYNFILGDITGLEERDGSLYLYNQPLDALYRYYPIEMLEEDEYFNKILDVFNEKLLNINPASTYINRNKALFALIWELVEQKYFTPDEVKIIKDYIPKTVLDPNKLDTLDYCIKSFLGIQGEEVIFSLEEPERNYEGNCVFQERIDVQAINMDIYTACEDSREILSPVIGTYVVGEKFAGIFTRAGGWITDKWAIYLPTYVKDLRGDING